MKNLILGVTTTVWLCGCVSFNAGSMHPVETALKQQYPDIRIDREFELTVRASLLGILDLVIEEDDMDFDLFKLERAEVGVYKIRNLPSLDGFELPLEKIGMPHCPVKEELVHIREDDEYVLIVGCMKRDKLQNIFLVVIDQDELTLVSARGDYDEILKLAMNSTDVDERHFHAAEEHHNETARHHQRRLHQ